MNESIVRALDQQRFETARRLAVEALHVSGEDPGILDALHSAQVALGEFADAARTLERLEKFWGAESPDGRRLLDLRAKDYEAYATDGHYRVSEEKAAGFTLDEFLEKYRHLARECRRKLPGEKPTEPEKPVAPAAPSSCAVFADSLTLKLSWPDGRRAAGVDVVVGWDSGADPVDTAAPIFPGLGLPPLKLDVRLERGVTDEEGVIVLTGVPFCSPAFVAVQLDGEKNEIATRFIAHSPLIPADRMCDLQISDWCSPAPEPPACQIPETAVVDGEIWKLSHQMPMRNPFAYDFPAQLVEWDIPVAGSFLVLDSEGNRLPAQACSSGLVFWCGLPADSEKIVGLYATDHPHPVLNCVAGGPVIECHPDGTATLSTGSAEFLLGWECSGQPPLIAVKGPDGVWRGRGRWDLPEGVGIIHQSAEIIEEGPVRIRARMTFRLCEHGDYVWEIEAHAGDACLLVREISPPLSKGGFEFSLQEFLGGRAYLHWNPEANSSRHWQTLEARDLEFARLQESVPWWIPPAGFGCAVTHGDLQSKDYIGLFTLRRGEWIDREFEKLTHGPGDDPAWRRELDWPFPEMVGSTISMITAGTKSNGDVVFRFGFFDGERRWGLMVSDLESNDGPRKEISDLQHKNSSPRLSQFVHWRLDEADQHLRPHVLAARQELPLLRRRKHNPFFRRSVEDLNRTDTEKRSAAAGMKLHLFGDVEAAWRWKCDVLRHARLRPRFCLMGRDAGDLYSPVGGRPVTHHAEDFDLLAPTGIFSPDEERTVRRYLMLMGHLFMEPDLMNWHFNSRNANFEADRVDIVGTVGVVFDGNPDADGFSKHAADLMQRSVETYCTPGSGKWYENPACYYLHAAKCRLNAAFHLTTHGHLDPTSISRFKDFFNWAVLLLTPPTPSRYEDFRDGHWPGDDSELIRRIPPIGDHAVLGKYIPDHFALFAKFFRDRDPAFADRLLWAFRQTGSSGGYFGAPALFLGRMCEAESARSPSPPLLQSRRLEGFGSVFRGGFGTPREFYLLIKQGPGGYRYHRTEGSFLLFAEGRPLVYDGGEGGETWRHSTLSFYDSHQPLSAGHVERFASLPALDFSQGVHPEIIAPGQPVYLSDDCHHGLVSIAEHRFLCPCPAVVRSFAWVKDSYLLVHDDLHLPAGISKFWNLQVVSDEEQWIRDGEWIFKGRFGVDLQVVVPGTSARESSVEQVPLHEYSTETSSRFSMRHLRISRAGDESYAALLHPTPPGAKRLDFSVNQLGRHMHVEGDDLRDDHLFSREPMTLMFSDFGIHARYASVLRRSEVAFVALPDGGEIRSDQRCWHVESGLGLQMCFRHKKLIGMDATGSGTVRDHQGREWHFKNSTNNPGIA